MAQRIDLMHLGRDRVIAAHLIDGVIVDPGPESCLPALLDGLPGEPRALLLTHIHLDHAGASGALVRRFPDLRVYVHRAGAPHLVDPSKLLKSAGRLYGDDMQRLWGEVVPVPAANVVALDGGERVEGVRVEHTPGHAVHHVCFFDESRGDAYVGDVAGVRIPPDEHTVAPTPPPDVDLEAWESSLDVVGAWSPRRLHLTHFGEVGDATAQLERTRARLRLQADWARSGDRLRFLSQLDGDLRATAPDVAERTRQAAPPEQLWLGLERYWRRRREALSGGATSYPEAR